MEETPKKSGSRIWLYLTPVYILLAIPLLKWTIRNQSGEVNMSKEEYNAFNSSEGEIKKSAAPAADPGLSDIGYTLHYRSGGSKNGTQEELDLGYKEGNLTAALAKSLGDAKALEELYNNQWMIKGFMGRPAVKSALASPEALKAVISDRGAVNAFFADETVTAALNDPQAVEVILQSDFAKTLLDAKAVQGLINDSASVEEILGANRGLVKILKRPPVKSFVIDSPQTESLAAAVGWK